MARSVWRQRLRKPALTNGREGDKPDFTDDESKDRADLDAPPLKDHAQGTDPHAPDQSDNEMYIGFLVVVALPFIASVVFLAIHADRGSLDLPWGHVATIVFGLLLAVCLTGFSWWAANAWRHRKDGSTEKHPPAERQDDQDSMEKQ
ncbi:hypothetical protein [Streptomyces sp. NPDC002588]|uniref:hypothetical protein n=1 Tax=Streptomyces sp. NPDC002588 TaxID=3154419 RepID=UPI00332E6116